MVVAAIFVVLALLIPVFIMRPFGTVTKIIVLSIIITHITIAWSLHFRLIDSAGSPIIADEHTDAKTYYKEELVTTKSS